MIQYNVADSYQSFGTLCCLIFRVEVKTEAIDPSKYWYKPTRCHIPEDQNLIKMLKLGQ